MVGVQCMEYCILRSCPLAPSKIYAGAELLWMVCIVCSWIISWGLIEQHISSASIDTGPYVIERITYIHHIGITIIQSLLAVWKPHNSTVLETMPYILFVEIRRLKKNRYLYTVIILHFCVICLCVCTYMYMTYWRRGVCFKIKIFWNLA